MKLAYRPDIDGLRAVAVLSVLVYHAFPAALPGGFIGVDVFFVISGFLITSILADELAEGRYSLAGFYARRILRIFPALALVLWACLVMGWHTLLADEYKLLGKHVAAGAGFLANFAFWFEAGYFDRASELKPLLHLWSLGIEEQFYIVWPLLLWAVWRWVPGARNGQGTATGQGAGTAPSGTRPQGLRRLGLVLALLSLGFACWAVAADRVQAFYSPLSRAWELMAGALLALATTGHGAAGLVSGAAPSGRASALSTRLLAVLTHPTTRLTAVAVLGVTLFGLHATDPFPGALALLPVLAAVVLLAPPKPSAHAAAPDRVGRWLASRPMVAVGLISYPLYLWHWPLLSLARIYESGEPPAALRAGLLVVAVVLATVTYLGVERPLRHLARGTRGRRWIVGGLLALVALAGAVGSNVYHRDGLERIRHRKMIQLDAQALQDFADFEKTGLITDARCAHPFHFPERDVCLFTRPEAPVTAVVVGDSHAVHAFWGLSQALQARGDNLQVRGRGACVPLLGLGNGDAPYHCQPAVDDTWHTIAADAAIRTVVITYRGRYLRNDAPPAEAQAYGAALDRTLALLEQAHKTVYYLLPVAEPGFDPRLCLGALPLGRKSPQSCTIDLAADRAKWQVLRRVLDDVLPRHPGVHVVDPTEAYCQDGQCPIIREGHSVFKDDNHVSYYGSLLIGARLKPASP